MEKIENQLKGLVTRNLGSGNAFGEFDNADGSSLDLNCDDTLGNAYTLDGMKTKLAEMEANQAIAMNRRANLITDRNTKQSAYDSANNLPSKTRGDRDVKEATKTRTYQPYIDAEKAVAQAYLDTQAGGDAITRFKLAYNCKLYKAQKAEEKRVADERAKGNVVATDVTLASAKPLGTDKLNNPPVPPKDATADQVKSATIEPEGSKGKKIALIGGGLLLLAVGVILFIRARKK